MSPSSSSSSHSLVPVDAADYTAISRLLNRYADAVVHRNGVQWASCWDVDAVWDLGKNRLVEGKESIVKLWYAAMGGMSAVFQIVHNGEAWYETGSSERAVGRWSISERYLTASGDRGLLLADYLDGFVKRDGSWLFSRRLLRPHYQGAPDLSGDFFNTRAGLESAGDSPDV
ncbi:MAG: nuclear transport factor 2 family protein [Ilumatobacteraceae bacterium]